MFENRESPAVLWPRIFLRMLPISVAIGVIFTVLVAVGAGVLDPLRRGFGLEASVAGAAFGLTFIPLMLLPLTGAAVFANLIASSSYSRWGDRVLSQRRREMTFAVVFSLPQGFVETVALNFVAPSLASVLAGMVFTVLTFGVVLLAVRLLAR